MLKDFHHFLTGMFGPSYGYFYKQFPHFSLYNTPSYKKGVTVHAMIAWPTFEAVSYDSFVGADGDGSVDDVVNVGALVELFANTPQHSIKVWPPSTERN